MGDYYYTLGPQHPNNTSLFYTAGHEVTVGASVSALLNGLYTPIGKITAAKFKGDSDTSLITLTSSFEQSPLINYSMANPVAGTRVKMVGAISNAQSGTVSRINATVYYDELDVTLKNMGVADYECANGDSGAPIFNNYPSSGTLSDVTTCYGVQSGGLFTNKGVWAGESYFTLYENLL